MRPRRGAGRAPGGRAPGRGHVHGSQRANQRKGYQRAPRTNFLALCARAAPTLSACARRRAWARHRERGRRRAGAAAPWRPVGTAGGCLEGQVPAVARPPLARLRPRGARRGAAGFRRGFACGCGAAQPRARAQRRRRRPRARRAHTESRRERRFRGRERRPGRAAGSGRAECWECVEGGAAALSGGAGRRRRRPQGRRRVRPLTRRDSLPVLFFRFFFGGG